MIKIFISQPMRNISENDIFKKRNNAIEKLYKYLNKDFIILDSFFKIEYNNPLMYIAKSIELMAESDIVYFLEGFENNRGCIIEHACASCYMYNCIYEVDNVFGKSIIINEI